MNIQTLLTDFLKHLGEITVWFAILFALIALFLKPANGKKRDLEFVVNRAFSGSALPTGIALLGCAFRPDLLSSLDGASLNVAVAGITLLFISVKAVFVSE